LNKTLIETARKPEKSTIPSRGYDAAFKNEIQIQQPTDIDSRMLNTTSPIFGFIN
jgi:hypothetical protein